MEFPHHAKCHHCDAELVIVLDLSPINNRLAGIEQAITTEGARTVSALENLKAADQALKDEITTFLTDIAGQLAGGVSETDAQAIADDINAEVDALKAGDPVVPTPPPVP